MPSPSNSDLVDFETHSASPSLEAAALAIGRLDSRISVSSSRAAWLRRACWTGYTRALQLAGVEIDEVDVFSWATDVPILHRATRATNLDEFDAYPGWIHAISEKPGRHWREDLPFTPATGGIFEDAPRMVRAIELCRQYARAAEGPRPWLALPLLLQRLGVTSRPLPCLVAGDRAFRFGTRDTGAVLRRVIRELETRAERGLDMLRELEAERREAVRLISQIRRPGKILDLAASLAAIPIVTPQRAAERFHLSISGAGKLLDRAAELGLVLETSGRHSWKIYMTPEIAALLGYASRPRGRPKSVEPVAPLAKSVSDIVAAFDREMAEFERHYGLLPSEHGERDRIFPRGKIRSRAAGKDVTAKSYPPPLTTAR